MARKPHLVKAPASGSEPAADRPSADLQTLSDDLSAAVNSAQGEPGDNQ